MNRIKNVPKEEQQIAVSKQSDKSLLTKIDVLLNQFTNIFKKIVNLHLYVVQLLALIKFGWYLISDSFHIDDITSIVLPLLGVT